MDGNKELEIWEGIDSEECDDADCEYLSKTIDPFDTGDSWHVHYEHKPGCSPENCPLLAKKVREYLEEMNDD